MAIAVSGSMSVVTPWGNVEVGHPHLSADGELADVRLDGGRDGGRQRVDRQREHLLLHQPVAVVHLDRLAHQGDGHVGTDDLVAAHDHEVDVGHRLSHRVALHLAGEGEVGARPGVERQELVGPGLAVQGGPQLPGDDGDGQRVGPVAVDDAGDLPLAAQAADGTRAEGAPDLGGEYDFGHCGSPQVARAVCADGPWGLRRTAHQRSRPAGQRTTGP